jgi:hypothetical protein
MQKTYQKKIWPWLLLFIFTSMPQLVGQVWAQPAGMGSEGGRPGGQPRQMFDPRKAVTINGEIESLGSYGTSGWRSMPGMKLQGLVLKTDQGNIEVHLGPPNYVKEQNFFLQKGDILEVNGFKIVRDNQTAFFAAQVKKENQTLKLLDEKSMPVWRGHGPDGSGSGGGPGAGPGPGRGQGPEGAGFDGAGPGGMGRGGMRGSY